MCTPLKALLCSGDDAWPHHWSVLRAMHTLNNLKNYIPMLKGLSPIHSMRWSRAKGLTWGTRGPYLLAAAMVGYGCVGQWWQLEANIRSIYCGNSKNCLQKFFFNSYADPIYSWHLTRQLNKEDLDLLAFAFSWFLCPMFYGSHLITSLWVLTWQTRKTTLWTHRMTCTEPLGLTILLSKIHNLCSLPHSEFNCY